MKILHVNKFFDLHGGAEVYLHRLMEKQRAAGHEVHAFSTRSEKNLPSDDRASFVTRYRYDRSEGAKKDAIKAANFLWNREARAAMERALDDVKPDVVHLHNIYHHLSTSILSPIRRRRISCVQTLHDYKVAGCANYKMFTEGAPCERCKDGNYANAIAHHCLSASLVPNVLAALEMGVVKARQSYARSVRLFLCPSRFMKEKMEDWGEPPGKLRYLPQPMLLPDEQAPGGGGYLLYVGRLQFEKGLASFIEAAATVPEFPVKIIGSGPEEERLKSLARSKGANHIEFLGFLAPEEVTKIRRRAEAFLLPTLMYENASLSLLEAMADGLPCLATRIGGNPELVEDGANGFLVKPGDADDWLRAIRRLQACPSDVRQKMGLIGRDKVAANHDWKKHLDQVMESYVEAGADVI